MAPEVRDLIERHLQASRLPVVALKCEEVLPQVEVLITAAQKELNFINFVIQATIENSLNPIQQVTIAVPKDSMSDFFNETARINERAVPIFIKDENEILGLELASKLDVRFGTRSGWSKAEFIKFIFISLSKAKGVLVVDADTLFLHPRVWIDSELKQIVTPVQEYHSIYFQLYKFLGLPTALVNISFMSHYQLFQPTILNEAFKIIANNDIDLLFQKIAGFVPVTENSPFCICYEMYAHFLLSEYASQACQEKWANRGIKRDKVLSFKNFDNIKKAYKNYSSISCHEYLK
jgi:hypothetical protein